MNDSSSPLAPLPAAPEVTLESLAQAQQSLRSSFHITLIMIVVLSGSLFVFFLREVSLARRQVRELNQVVADYEKSAVPLMDDFRNKLQAFTKSYPDFGPIFLKYFGTNAAAVAPSAVRAQPLTNPNAARLPPGR